MNAEKVKTLGVIKSNKKKNAETKNVCVHKETQVNREKNEILDAIRSGLMFVASRVLAFACITV